MAGLSQKLDILRAIEFTTGHYIPPASFAYLSRSRLAASFFGLSTRGSANFAYFDDDDGALELPGRFFIFAFFCDGRRVGRGNILPHLRVVLRAETPGPDFLRGGRPTRAFPARGEPSA